jgi:glyoxylate carboligase
MTLTVADALVETAVRAGVERVYGVIRDSLNPVGDSIRRDGRLRWVHVRHEEAAAFAAGAEAQLRTFLRDHHVCIIECATTSVTSAVSEIRLIADSTAARRHRIQLADAGFGAESAPIRRHRTARVAYGLAALRRRVIREQV